MNAQRASLGGLMPPLLGLSLLLSVVGACGDVRRAPITLGAGSSDASETGVGGRGARAPCASNADCAVNQPRCDTASGRCESCESDADCRASAPRCDSTSGACVECLENGDCPGDGCPGGSGCPRAEAVLCHPSLHRCVECVSDGHCTSVGERCSTALGVCATPCETPSVCPNDEPVCDAVVGFCVGCISDSDCSSPLPYCRRSECTQ